MCGSMNVSSIFGSCCGSVVDEIGKPGLKSRKYLSLKDVSPILAGKASIIQVTLNVRQKEAGRDSPLMLWMTMTGQAAAAEDDDQTDD